MDRERDFITTSQANQLDKLGLDYAQAVKLNAKALFELLDSPKINIDPDNDSHKFSIKGVAGKSRSEGIALGRLLIGKLDSNKIGLQKIRDCIRKHDPDHR